MRSGLMAAAVSAALFAAGAETPDTRPGDAAAAATPPATRPVTGPTTRPQRPPPIRSVVKSVTDINFVPRLPVGADDGVRKGMGFRVYDRDGTRFLGYLDVLGVDPHESVGHLAGPGVGEVRPGCVVVQRTDDAGDTADAAPATR